MGSPIDEISERSHPNYFAMILEKGELDQAELKYAQQAAQNRDDLATAMLTAGFQRHPGEWWHFCLGDQMWVWLSQSQHPDLQVAQYGRYDLLGKGMT